MPKRTDIKSILIIGAGPIVIGQACEFDYSGTQACKALKEEGYRIVLVNSNPATIMTDPDLADATYIEPITPEIVAKIIEKERPDALLPTMGGQTALNTALSLKKMGVQVTAKASGKRQGSTLILPVIGGILTGAIISTRIAHRMNLIEQVRLGFGLAFSAAALASSSALPVIAWELSPPTAPVAPATPAPPRARARAERPKPLAAPEQIRPLLA